MLVDEFLKPLKITQTEFARRVGSTHARLNEIIHEKRGVTPDTAMRFQAAPAAREIAKIERLPQLDLVAGKKVAR